MADMEAIQKASQLLGEDLAESDVATHDPTLFAFMMSVASTLEHGVENGADIPEEVLVMYQGIAEAYLAGRVT